MRTVFIIFVFIVFISGCKNVIAPTIEALGWIDEHSDRLNQPYDWYKSVVTVSYQNGNPCTTAYGQYISPYFQNGDYADSTGKLEFRFEIFDNKKDNPRTQKCVCVIFESINGKVVWEGEIEFIKYSNSNNRWPEPYIEIVIPD